MSSKTSLMSEMQSKFDSFYSDIMNQLESANSSLEKKPLSSESDSKREWSVSIPDKIQDGFRFEASAFSDKEVLIIDAEKDPKLKECVETAKKLLKISTGSETRARLLAKFVLMKLKESNAEQVAFPSKELSEATKILPIGYFLGNASQHYHRALLYKYLADRTCREPSEWSKKDKTPEPIICKLEAVQKSLKCLVEVVDKTGKKQFSEIELCTGSKPGEPTENPASIEVDAKENKDSLFSHHFQKDLNGHLMLAKDGNQIFEINFFSQAQNPLSKPILNNADLDLAFQSAFGYPDETAFKYYILNSPTGHLDPINAVTLKMDPAKSQNPSSSKISPEVLLDFFAPVASDYKSPLARYPWAHPFGPIPLKNALSVLERAVDLLTEQHEDHPLREIASLFKELLSCQALLSEQQASNILPSSKEEFTKMKESTDNTVVHPGMVLDRSKRPLASLQDPKIPLQLINRMLGRIESLLKRHQKSSQPFDPIFCLQVLSLDEAWCKESRAFTAKAGASDCISISIGDLYTIQQKGVQWPHSPSALKAIEAAGFVHQPSLLKSDMSMCSKCNAVIERLRPWHNPLKMHRLENHSTKSRLEILKKIQEEELYSASEAAAFENSILNSPIGHIYEFVIKDLILIDKRLVGSIPGNTPLPDLPPRDPNYKSTVYCEFPIKEFAPPSPLKDALNAVSRALAILASYIDHPLCPIAAHFKKTIHTQSQIAGWRHFDVYLYSPEEYVKLRKAHAGIPLSPLTVLIDSSSPFRSLRDLEGYGASVINLFIERVEMVLNWLQKQDKPFDPICCIQLLSSDRGLMNASGNYLAVSEKLVTKILKMYPDKFAAFKKLGSKGVPWPHSLAVRKAIQAAGFVYRPMIVKRDHCVCLGCSVEVGGWRPWDDPWKMHDLRKHTPQERELILNKIRESEAAKKDAPPKPTT